MAQVIAFTLRKVRQRADERLDPVVLGDFNLFFQTPDQQDAATVEAKTSTSRSRISADQWMHRYKSPCE